MSEVPPLGPVGFGMPSRRPGEVGRPSCRSGWGQKAHPEVREVSGGPFEGLEGPPGDSGGVGRPTRRFEWGQKALLVGSQPILDLR